MIFEPLLSRFIPGGIYVGTAYAGECETSVCKFCGARYDGISLTCASFFDEGRTQHGWHR